MASIEETARRLIQDFPRAESMEVEAAVRWALKKAGATEAEALEIATLHFVGRVLSRLRASPPQILPFLFSTNDDRLLVGKSRVLRGDSAETAALRQRLELIPQMRVVLHAVGDCAFERLSAGVMQLSGASESIAMCSGDEGGIDFYGRLPMRIGTEDAHRSLAATTVLEQKLLFLGQAKCFHPDAVVGPEEIRAFHGAVDMCLRQYDGAQRPPAHRVPKAYYRHSELTLRIFTTSATFSPGAIEAAKTSDIALVDGVKIAQFLLYHGVGMTAEGGGMRVDIEKLREWASRR